MARGCGWRVLAAAAGGVGLGAGAMGQTITFARTTDTISFQTACLSSPTAATVEVRFRVSGTGFGGEFFGEHQAFAFDRQLGVSAGSVYEYSHPIDSGELWQVPAAVTPDQWHHLAFCYDGLVESMYFDGALLASRPRSGGIASSCPNPGQGVASLGWIRRTDGAMNVSFIGEMDWFRSSSVVRYTGAAYTVPTEPIAPDAGTLLLYSFDECEASGVVHDLGPLHRDGQLGGGGGTSPVLSSPIYANCDRSTVPPVLNVNDFVCFQTEFAAGDTRANCDGSTAAPVLNVSDFICFLNRFAAGC